MILSGHMAVLASPGVDELRSRLSRGLKATDSDINFLSTELSKNPADPFTCLTAGEALASKGLYGLANDQYAAADKSSADFVLNQFKKIFAHDQFSSALMFLYLQDKYPRDPAVLFYAARKNLAAITFSRESKQKALSNARKELSEAIQTSDPYPGTFATLAMLEYNEGKIGSALSLVNQELKRNPKEPLALRINALALVKTGRKQSEVVEGITRALQESPMDDEMNLLLGRVYLGAKQYDKAIVPSLLGLYWQHDAQTLSEAKHQVYDLMEYADKRVLQAAINDLSFKLSEPGTNGGGFRSTLFRIRLADLFSIRGNRKNACAQLAAAYAMHPHFHSAVAFKLGQELAAMHLYGESLQFLNEAVQYNTVQQDEKKYRVFRDRIAAVNANSSRDLALQLKKSFDEPIVKQLDKLPHQ